MKVVVGSDNPVKMGAAKNVFKRFFSDVDVDGVKVDSRVSEQPLSLEETKRYACMQNLETYAFEISGRIVAGTNVGIGTSPYAYLKYGDNMYTGRRIALEIKRAWESKRLQEIVT